MICSSLALNSFPLMAFFFSLACHTKGKTKVAITKKRIEIATKIGGEIQAEKYLLANRKKVAVTIKPKVRPSQILFFKDVEYIMLLFKVLSKTTIYQDLSRPDVPIQTSFWAFIFMYSLGVSPVSFLKALLKVDFDVNPAS